MLWCPLLSGTAAWSWSAPSQTYSHPPSPRGRVSSEKRPSAQLIAVLFVGSHIVIVPPLQLSPCGNGISLYADLTSHRILGFHGLGMVRTLSVLHYQEKAASHQGLSQGPFCLIGKALATCSHNEQCSINPLPTAALADSPNRVRDSWSIVK